MFQVPPCFIFYISSPDEDPDGSKQSDCNNKYSWLYINYQLDVLIIIYS